MPSSEAASTNQRTSVCCNGILEAVSRERAERRRIRLLTRKLVTARDARRKALRELVAAVGADAAARVTGLTRRQVAQLVRDSR